MKNIYMVQASDTYKGKGFRAAYLPYAAGLLISYAFTNDAIKKDYCFKRFVFTRENTDKCVESMESPAVVGFSCYIWNTQYNLVLAQKIKERFPGCIIIFGGHNVPPDNSFLERYSFIDFLIHSEGEEAFCSLLLELAKPSPDYSSVPNLSYRGKNGNAEKNPTVIQSKTDYPSPYLCGLFESIFEENPDMQLDAILETSRGCPNSCAYCDWGCNGTKIRLFPTERVLAEIDWMASHKVRFIWGADSNFGFAKRDIGIIDYLIETKEKTGFPERLRINYSMQKPETVFEISRKLEKHGLSKEGATLSFQSLSPEVLKNIGRKNMSMEKFSELLEMYTREGITTYSELIIGLPGETYDSFCKGIGTLLAAGQHRLITVYNCEVLPNSPMADPQYIKKHGIRTVEVNSLSSHSEGEEQITEKTVHVTGTATLSVEDWIACNIFACFEESLHHYGILKFIAIYLHQEKNIPYDEIYNMVIRYTKKNEDSVLRPAYDFLYEYYKNTAEGKPIKAYRNELFGKASWINKKVPHLATIYRLDEFYWEIKPSLRYLGVEDDIIEELIRFQETVLKLPFKNNYAAEFTKDWASYFCNAVSGIRVPLESKKIVLKVNNKIHARNWRDYATESVWFGKNGITFNTGITVEYK
ncbi:MAG: radical SAM protein [Clostridia bacterium]|nr:radical SAM protein [Clostridia bacterium]